MALISTMLILILITIAVFILSSLPLYFAVVFLGGKTSLLKTAFVSLIAGLIVSAIQFRFKTFGALLSFFVLIWIYHEVFRLKWFKAFLAWVLQLVFIVIFYIVSALFLATIVGTTLFRLVSA